MSFRIVHGAMARKSAVVSSSEATYWTKGRLLSLNTTGQIIVNTAPATNRLVGIALEDRMNPSVVHPTVTNLKVGAPNGEQASFIMDPSVIEQEQNLESGITFTAGDRIYCSTNGKITTSGNSTGPSGPVIGLALSAYAVSADTQRPLTYFFNVEY